MGGVHYFLKYRGACWKTLDYILVDTMTLNKMSDEIQNGLDKHGNPEHELSTKAAPHTSIHSFKVAKIDQSLLLLAIAILNATHRKHETGLLTD